MKKTPSIFDLENTARKRVEFGSRKLPDVAVGEIRWYYVGINIGQEISKGKPYLRPCIVIRKFPGSSLIRIAPLTTTNPRNKKFSIPIKDSHKFGLKKSWVSVKNIGSIDKKRLIKRHNSSLIARNFCKFLLFQ